MRTRSMTMSTCDWIHCLQSLMFFMMGLSSFSLVVVGCWMFAVGCWMFFCDLVPAAPAWDSSDLGPFGGYSHFGQINAGLALVRGIVTHPKQSILPDQAGITGVAAGWQFEKLRQFACVCVQPRQRCANRAIVQSNGRN